MSHFCFGLYDRWLIVAGAALRRILRAREDYRAVHAALDAIYQDPLSAGFVGPRAIVPEEVQRAALAIASRPALRDAALALLRATHHVRRRRDA